jgi:hypothetical protein
MNQLVAKPRSGRWGIPAAFVVAALLILGAVWAGPAVAAPPSFGIEGSGAGEISGEPGGAAIDQESGDVYIGDRNNSRVEKFGPEGDFLLAWGWGVADGSTEALQTCTSTCFGGFPSPPFTGSGTGQFRSLEGIAVDNSLSTSHGDVYVVDSGNNRIEKFGPQGEFLLMFGGEVNAITKGNLCSAAEECKEGVANTGAGEFSGLGGRAIAIDSSGVVYVADENRVQRFSPAGVVTGEIAFPGAGRIENLAVDSAKDIYLSGGELVGVHKYDAIGAELGLPRDTTGEPGHLAIAIGPADELFVNDLTAERHHILTFTEGGEQTASFDAGERPRDGFRGIAWGEALGALYVLNEGTTRIVTPPPPGPLVLEGSETATEIQPTTATLGATINPEGAEPTSYHFEYGPTTTYGESTPDTALGGEPFEDQPASAALTGLAPGTTYHFRVVATNAAAETTFGADQTFTTLPPVSIDQTSVSQVDATSARLEAELNPHGVAGEYHFEYGTSTEYGTSVPSPDGSIGAGTSDTTVSNLIQDLVPSTTYHYRVVAHNGLGPAVGPDRTFTTQGGSSTLPDERTWELVSPPNKHGSPLEPLTEEGGLIQAAAGGGGFAYIALGPIDGEPKGVRSPLNTQLIATRGAEGWTTQDVSTANEEISIVRPGVPSEYKFFADGLQSSIVEPQGVTPLSPQTTERTPYQREPDGEFTPLVSAANVPAGTEFAGEETPEGTGQFSNGVVFRTANSDLSRILLDSPQVLAPGFAPGFEPGEQPNLYEFDKGSLHLVSVLPNGEPAAEAGLSSGVGSNDLNMRGAISTDGERVVFETNSGEHLYMRDLGLGRTVQVDERQPGASGGVGQAVFQIANADDSKVFFTDESRLTTDATAQPGKPDLYMCAIAVVGEQPTCTLSDLTVDPNLGQAADVRVKVSAIDASGEHVYFAANGVLTSSPNAAGEHALPGNCDSEGEATCNLYEYDTVSKQISLVALLASGDSPDWGGRGNHHALGNLTARSSPNGRYFTFMSKRSLTGYDNHDVRSNAADEEVFLFDSADGSLHCVSCNPTGARPQGIFDPELFPGLLVDHPKTWAEKWMAASIPGWTLGPTVNLALYQSRYLSDSGRMFFNAADALVPQDTNKVEDVYQYEPPGVGDCSSTSRTFSTASEGCVNLISSGGSKDESAFLDASENGDEVFFLTGSRLVGSDVDGALDIYDAHICSSSSPCPPPPAAPAPACEGDSCQNPGSPPNNPTPSSLTYKGPGNVTAPTSAAPASKPKPKPLTRAQLLARALKSCKKDKAKKKRASCEKQARKKYGPVKHKAKAKSKARAKKAGQAQKAGGRS